MSFIKSFLKILYFVLFPLCVQGQINYPPGSVVNILEYGDNLNDGKTDATDAINKAIREHDLDLFQRKILFFPEGTYLLSSSIYIDAINPEKLNGSGKSIIFQGAGSAYTFFKLKDGVFTDPENPRPVLSTSEADPMVKGYTNIAFMTSIFDLTVDIGKDNPGAIGIRYIANNQGSIRDVDIITSDINHQGYAGIDMERAKIPGPALIKNVNIIGFDYGLRFGSLNYGMTLEDVTIDGYKIAGLHNDGHIISARKLKTKNGIGPAIVNKHKDGYITLMDSKLNGSGKSGIENRGFLNLINVSFEGFESLQDASENDGFVKEYYSHSVKKNDGFVSKNHKVLETPEVIKTPMAGWVNVLDFGYSPGDDDAGPAIQRAIDFMNRPGNAGYNTLFFPWAEYKITSPVRVYGNVLKIDGNFASFYSTKEKDNSATPLFKIESTHYPELFIERFSVVAQGRRKMFPVFANSSDKDLVLRNIYIGHGKAYQNNNASGVLFLEDVCSLSQVYYSKVDDPFEEAQPQFEFGDQTVFARQLNTEQRYTHLQTDGGHLWILGIKTEEPGVIIEAKNGANVWLYGGTILPSFADIGDPMFLIKDSNATLLVAEHIGKPKYEIGAYYQKILETVDHTGKSSSMFKNDFLQRNEFGSVVQVFVSDSKEMANQSSIVKEATEN